MLISLLVSVYRLSTWNIKKHLIFILTKYEKWYACTIKNRFIGLWTHAPFLVLISNVMEFSSNKMVWWTCIILVITLLTKFMHILFKHRCITPGFSTMFINTFTTLGIIFEGFYDMHITAHILWSKITYIKPISGRKTEVNTCSFNVIKECRIDV